MALAPTTGVALAGGLQDSGVDATLQFFIPEVWGQSIMDYMEKNGVINQSFFKGTFLGDDIAFCNEIRSAIEITISETPKN